MLLLASTLLFADHLWGSWSWTGIAIGVVLAIVIIGIVWVVIKESGVPIPAWVLKILWLVLLAVVAIVAIKFVASL